MLKQITSIGRGKHYALMSKSNPHKVLKHFGKMKPNKTKVLKEERRINYFKHRGSM